MRPLARAAGLGASWALLASSALAAPITFNTALPVATGEFVFRQQLIYGRSGKDPSSARRQREEIVSISVLGYGVDADLALFGILPVVNRSLELDAGGGRRSRSASGVGDLTLFGRYLVFARNRRGATLRVAPILGLSAPTGKSARRDAFGRLPPGIQSGSGAWNPLAGLVVTHATLDYQVDGQVSYRLNTEANGVEFGDVARLDASLQVRLWPRELKGEVFGFLYGVLEANLIHRQRNDVGGVANRNSGGTTLFLAPGLQFVTKRWIVEAVVQLPAVQNLHGTALESGPIARLGVRVNF